MNEIYVIDDFLEDFVLKETIKSLHFRDYFEMKYPTKSFYVQNPETTFVKYVISKLEKFENVKIDNILSFFRISTDKLDTEWRIHSDLNIAGQKPDRALVLYISPKERKDLHGTAFWEHEIYGKSLPKNTTNEEYDRMILKESENLDIWTLNSVIGYEQNRALSYPAHYFHSKYPNKSWENGREVFVMFYKIKKL